VYGVASQKRLVVLVSLKLSPRLADWEENIERARRWLGAVRRKRRATLGLGRCGVADLQRQALARAASAFGGLRVG
jgi:hypothetical protein